MPTSMHFSHLRKWIIASPPVEFIINRVRELLLGALRQGPIPQHIAFVMDGNRRFARSHGIETIEGHHLGFEALARILEVCYKSGVKVVTIYAFSIENFNRSQFEVNGLMDMANVKLAQLAQHGDILDRYGASIRFLGRKDLLRPDVVAAVDRAVEVTSRNGDRVLNICCPYTSRDEITQAIRQTVIDYSTPFEASRGNRARKPFSESHIASNIRAQNMKDQEGSGDADSISASSQDEDNGSPSANHANSGYDSPSSFSSSTTLHLNGQNNGNSDLLSPEFITPQTLTERMYTGNNPPIDILIRTSGVERLSDFMLWQCHEDTELAFLDVLWPEFDLWHFLPVLWKWQRRVTKSWKGESGLDNDDWKGSRDNNISVAETTTQIEAF
ncbi:prenyltransferase, putative [Talaromyces stipitatus ATCC 10500]|uniref:Alkyl transferase n=1 Tax=Talaromyces stipitatus (strain ATCC 10500 / CBS 375.48 / QM 6759 / NRRL 1006) TaxID=441959 RepID=B8LVZ9_TALSN|nr:prenyltransferase, putative [Talaromyces stipitatus ATCC 10500]EED24365.1 prenyltransferase, putative [Talaromyces stipitatus ATCC 10500]